MVNKIPICLIYVLTLLLNGCNIQSNRSLETHRDSLLSLFGSPDALAASSLWKVVVEINGNKKEFDLSSKSTNILILRSMMHDGILSSGDLLIKQYGSTCVKVGFIHVFDDKGDRKFDLLRASTALPLYRVEIPNIESSGSSIIYFCNKNQKTALEIFK